MLTVEQLVEARDQVETVDYDLDTGDKRSCGSCTVNWNTPFGELQYVASFGSDGAPEDTWWELDGKKLEGDDWDELGCELGFHFPHYYHGDRAEDRWREDEETEVLNRLQSHLGELTV